MATGAAGATDPATAGSVGIGAPHLIQNFVDCWASNPHASHFNEAMIDIFLSTVQHDNTCI